MLLSAVSGVSSKICVGLIFKGDVSPKFVEVMNLSGKRWETSLYFRATRVETHLFAAWEVVCCMVMLGSG